MSDEMRSRIAQLERDNLDLRVRATRTADADRLIAWLHEVPRRGAGTAFTAGPDRDLAREIEWVLAGLA